ncbi:MAG: nucleotidyltransferase [bacterium]
MEKRRLDVEDKIKSDEGRIFAQWLRILSEKEVPYVLGGAFATYAYTSIWRDTKDLDIFLPPFYLKSALSEFDKAGYETEVRDVCWLAKVYQNTYFMDLIFGTSSNQLLIDENWFEHSHPIKILGVPAHLIAIEELIASKIYMVKHVRFDGADIAHLIHSLKGNINWQQVLNLIHDNKGILLWHLIYFDFVYPALSDYLPKKLMVNLFKQMQEEWLELRDPKVFRGMLLDPQSFALDCEKWGYKDGCVLFPLVNHKGEKV